jgi:hypothetical protein
VYVYFFTPKYVYIYLKLPAYPAYPLDPPLPDRKRNSRRG